MASFSHRTAQQILFNFTNLFQFIFLTFAIPKVSHQQPIFTNFTLQRHFTPTAAHWTEPIFLAGPLRIRFTHKLYTFHKNESVVVAGTAVGRVGYIIYVGTPKRRFDQTYWCNGANVDIGCRNFPPFANQSERLLAGILESGPVPDYDDSICRQSRLFCNPYDIYCNFTCWPAWYVKITNSKSSKDAAFFVNSTGDIIASRTIDLAGEPKLQTLFEIEAILYLNTITRQFDRVVDVDRALVIVHTWVVTNNPPRIPSIALTTHPKCSATAGTVFAHVYATDIETRQLTYGLFDGNSGQIDRTAGSFSISNDGQIVKATSTPLTSLEFVTVVVRDGGDQQTTSGVQISCED